LISFLTIGKDDFKFIEKFIHKINLDNSLIFLESVVLYVYMAICLTIRNRVALQFTQSYEALILSRMTIVSRRKPPFYDGHSSLYSTVRRWQFIVDVRPRFYDSSVSYERSFTLIPDISSCIDYTSSSLSNVLVSIGDIGVGGTRTFQFSRPELLVFLYLFKFHNEFCGLTTIYCYRDCNR